MREGHIRTAAILLASLLAGCTTDSMVLTHTPAASDSGVLAFATAGSLQRTADRRSFAPGAPLNLSGELLFPERLRNTYQEMRAATAPGMRFEYEPPTIGFINNSLYIGTSTDGHTIGRVVDGKYELIASSRRKPAEHPLDEVPPSKITALFPGTNGRPCALSNVRARRSCSEGACPVTRRAGLTGLTGSSG